MSDVVTDQEADYLMRYADVAAEVQRGRFKSGREHYEIHGKFEGRIWNDEVAQASAPSQREPDPEPAPVPEIPLVGSCDVMILSEQGFFVDGWVDDRLNTVGGIEAIDLGSGARSLSPAFRNRRLDVEAALGNPNPAEFGLWAMGRLPVVGQTHGLSLVLSYRDGSVREFAPNNTLRLSQREFFENTLAHYGRRNLLTNLTARSFSELNGSLGELLTTMYAELKETRRTLSDANFPARKKPRISLICCLYGIPDFLYMQIAEFSRFADLAEVEFLYVSNSPELEDILLRDAELAAFVFGTSVRVITLNQNCGFSYANNVGVEAAAADTIVIINPDVFPYSQEAVTAMFAYTDRDLGRNIVGGKLYYADGTVMHDGMFFELEPKMTALCRVPVWTVEHFRKGFADIAGQQQRPVPAITGALMVFDRRFFRELGAFDETFIYGHYEDADLCLRARAAGGQVILDPELAFWHYEGKGSVKRPEHAGSGLYNRWLFSQRWGRQLEGANNV
jgi:GT2 family glycosyltransferase